MSLKSKRICKCCGKGYEYCPHCGTKSDEMWRNLTDTKECLAVFNIVAAYNVGRATADQVKKVLADNNITDYSTYNPSIVAALDKICKPAKEVETPKVETPKVEAPKVEAPKDETVVEPVITQPVLPEVPKAYENNAPRKVRNKKKYRRNADVEL